MKIYRTKSPNIFLFILLAFCLFQINSQTIYDISEEVSSEYKKAEFSKNENNIYYFKHTLSEIPKSRVTAFRFVFDQFDRTFIGSNIVCTVVDESTPDDELITTLNQIITTRSNCIGEFNENDNGNYDAIIKLDTTKKKIGIRLHLEGIINFKARIYLRILEASLEQTEQKKKVDESHSLVPLSVVISDFRQYASKILFYSMTRELQMYYIESEATYPEKLFSGNVLLVYTNANQVRQKYKNANTMVLLTRDFPKEDKVSELYQFEVKFFGSKYLLDYFVSNSLNGRSKNTPLIVNMTECASSYYMVLNYNRKEKKTSLYIDQIYGKIKKLSVVTNFTGISWDDMIIDDMQEIKYSDRYHELPADSESHIDIYKVECELPLLLNFYYVNEQETIPELDYGNVAIVNLKGHKTYTFNFKSDITTPTLSIEIFNPVKLPNVIIDDGQNENIVSKNSLIKSTPMSTSNPLVIRERSGDTGTRVIIKVGYSISSSDWVKEKGNIYKNNNLNLFVFSFPNEADKYNYTFADLITRGTIDGDNIKYCFGTSIGAPILPSAENCFRVSLNNSYTLKVLNPLIMHKDYDFSDDVGYYVSIKPMELTDKMEVISFLHKYNTEERNFEGISNVIQIGESSEMASTILTAPVNKDDKEFIQITQCAKRDIKIELIDGFTETQTVIEETTIPSGTKNFYKIVDNILLETILLVSGNGQDKVFVRHSGITTRYTPKVISNPSITFNSSTNQIIMQHPLEDYEKIEYTVYVGKKGELSSQDITLCTIAEGKNISKYSKSVISYAETASISINFDKVGLKSNEEFEAIVYYEQKLNTKMAFLSDVISGTVGEIKIDVITEINKEYDKDINYVYATGTATSDGNSLYFSYLPNDIRDVPVGAFRIEFNTESKLSLSTLSCAFVDEGEIPSGMIEAVEDIISKANPYCIGGKSTTNGKNYNYIFKYSYTKDNKPRRLVIKVTNNQKIQDGFTIYLRQGNNTYIEPTDFEKQKEYGAREEYEKTVMPYIIDLELIRGDSKDNYVSKLLLYSRYLDMQMYYLDDTIDRNMPILFFTGGIMLLLTKPELAKQKYHTTKLILLSENLNGQEHSILGNNFRFHTKMFKSSDQIEFFESNNPIGRTLNYPLSLEMNTCSGGNDKYIYILNYNRAEDERILYLDLIYGIMKKARVNTRINSNYWDDLINNDMEDIKDNQITLGKITQHIDVVEIQCQTPLLANAYYNTEKEEYLDLKKGNIAIKTLPASGSTTITLDPYLSGVIYCSISLFNPNNNADMTFKYGSISETIRGNTLKLTILAVAPKEITVVNNGDSATRFIFKIGYGVEQEKDWKQEERKINGVLYYNKNKYVYKFPYGNDKRNFTDVQFLVTPLKKDTGEVSPNLKFCYSTSMGMAIDSSKENCFRTGANIPYTLSFINPLVAPKNYNTLIDNYYITFNPYYSSEYISLDITENKYDIEKRSIEGIPSVLDFGTDYEKGIILSIPSNSSNSKIFIQLQACVASEYDNITYINSNAYTKEEISRGMLHKNSKLFYYPLDNNKMETQINFIGYQNNKVFVKHIGSSDTSFELEEYSASWIENKNTVNIIKPMKNNEAFRITVLISPKDHFKDFSLCTFVETKNYDDLADYVATFTSTSSDVVTRYIDFSSIHYEVGQEFDLLVYAVQVNKNKLEVLYNVITGKVGKIEGIDQITGTIPNKKDYVTTLFTKNTTSSNYLYYTFDTNPVGDIASLKIKADKDTGMSISKVACTFVETDASPEEMIQKVNEAERDMNNLCAGETFKDSNGFDALINCAKVKSGIKKLVILVKYGMSDDDNYNNDLNDEIVKMNITIRTSGYKVDKEDYGYNEDEELTLVPYILDLKEIREMQKENYHSKVLIYSSTRELDMFYIQDGAPVELFSGNIMMVYTNEDVIREKYNGASTMILLTDSLSVKKTVPFGEKFKFKITFFNSAKTMQYYVSANPNGRPLNNPTSIEMLNCDQPYYYILNYHHFEGDRMLHIDTIFGEINTTKFADQLTADSWDTFVSSMESFKGDEIIIDGQNKYHIDVFEVTCKTPLLLNIYYTDDANPKKSNLQQGDVSIITLYPNSKESLSFIENLSGDRFLYSFYVHRTYGTPDILIEFESKSDMRINQNGIYIKNTTENYRLITVSNKRLTGDDSTKVIFKFGYNLDENFIKIENDIYNIQNPNKSANLFAYVFKKGEDRLNYTKVQFEVSTTYDNVKFCYSTNLGAFINPSTQNCFRVGKKNSYTIEVMNPYIMYKDYTTGDDVMDYFVSFRTENKDLNITILPKLIKYDTNNRNIPDIPSTLKINNEGKTILTNPDNKEYLFVQMELCTDNSAVTYEFKNAFYNKSLGENGEIQSRIKYKYKSLLNTKLDTELVVKSETKNIEMFIKHTGLNDEFSPNVIGITIKYKNNILAFNQPIGGENFKYTILVDKKNNIKNQHYTLCNITTPGKKAHFTGYVTSAEREISYELNFKDDLEGYEDFETLILAEEIDNGKMVILSDIFSPKGNENKDSDKKKTRNALIVIIIILAVVCIGGGIGVYAYLRKLKNRPRGALIAKRTDSNDVDGMENDKLVESMSRSQANE